MAVGDATPGPPGLLARLAATPVTINAALQERGSDALLRRPAPRAWSATEIACHLRDVEELFQLRFHTIVALDDPVILVFGADDAHLAPWRIGGAIGHPLDPDRWAEDRQYRRHDAAAAPAAFRRRRDEVLTLRHGPPSLGAWVARLAAHDDNHVDQLQRALDRRV